MLLRRFVIALLLVSLSTVSLSAQQTKRNLEEQPRKVKQELKKAYVNWINDVDLILTKSERDAWAKLATDNEREKFIEEFWRSRDSDPDTEENEFKEQFFERMAYANEHFSSVKPGRMTDRGRIYIKLASPTRSSRIPPVARMSALRTKAADPRQLIHSRSGSIDTFRMSEAASSSNLLTRPDRVSTG